MAGKKLSIDMSRGPLFGKIIRYALPLMLAYLLQLAFHAADMVVIGRWGSPASLAAIGATVSITGLIINVLTGLATGANVLAAQFFGARDSRSMTKLVHTTIAISIIGGIAAAVLGLIMVRWMVDVTDIPEESQSKSILYLVICFLGVPFQILYNFGSAILRAIGNTRSPLYYLVISGTVNVLLNLFLVVVCHMDVAGVALATAAANGISAYLVLRRLQKNHGSTRLYLKNLRVDKKSLQGILRLGVPAGLQSACFALSNLVVQSAINSFGVAAVAGLTAGYHIELLLYAVVFALHHTTIAVVGQNYGAKQYPRIIKSIYILFGTATVATLVTGTLFYLASPYLIGIFSSDPEVIKYGVIRAGAMFTVYFLLGFMDISSGIIRGLGNSFYPAISTLAGTCGIRILWTKFVFPHIGTMNSVLIVYPLSWTLVAVGNIAVLIIMCKKLLRPNQSDGLLIQPKVK